MITRLRTFLAVVRYGSFERAGEAIGLTQGAVSAQIQKLEQELGALLFDRTGRRAVLNIFGRQTAIQAEDIVAVTDHLKNSSKIRQTHETLTIASISTQSVWSMHALAAFRKAVPGIKIRIIPGTSHQLANQVDSGEIDMAIIIRPPYFLPSELRWHSLAREPFVMLVPKSYAGTDWHEALCTLPFLRYDRSSFGGRIVGQFLAAQNITVEQIIESDDLDGLIEAVAQDMGVTIVPAIEANLPFPDSVRIIPLDKLALHREVGVVERVTSFQSEEAALLIRFMVDHAAKSSIATRHYINTGNYSAQF
ncbi:MAG: LysR family transcriptional regulator [Polaromonas sp.]|nr:LysR family transcriptional regulator [Polaromonas sp.]